MTAAADGAFDSQHIDYTEPVDRLKKRTIVTLGDSDSRKKTGSRPKSGRAESLGRPRTDGRRPLTREAILRVAERQFSTVGYAATSIRKLADELDVFAASIYHQFPSKESILDEIFSDWLGREASYFRRVSDLKLPPDVALYKLVYEDCRYVASRELGPQRLFMLPEIRGGKFPQVRKLWNVLRDTYQGLMQKGMASGVFQDVSAKLYAEHFISLSCTVLICPEPEELGSPEHQATVAADLALRSVLQRPNRLDAIRGKAAAVEIKLEA